MDGVADSIMSGEEQHELPQTSEVVTSNNSTDLINNPESLPSSSSTAQIAPSSLSGLNLLALLSTPPSSSDTSVPTTAAILEEETFKMPTLPPAHARSIPADIAHIIAMGLNEPDPADEELASGKGTSNYEQVVKEMREKAGFGTIKQEPEAGNELDNVEKEMEVRGVVRVVEEPGIKMEVEEEEEEEEDDVKPDLMDGDRQSSPISSSSSSSDDDIELESLLLPAQALSQTKGKAKKNRKRSNKPSADSDLSDDDINTSAAPATEHEIAQPEIVLPALEKIPEGNEIKSFGRVVSIIENVVVLKAEGEKKVLDEGCLCCWADGTVIGTIFEVFGSVIQPFYSLRFPNASPPSPEIYTIGKLVYYSPSMASYVFTQQLRAQKGSDASNVWDEEIGANEMEWSDDEEEQEYKRNLKNDRKVRTGSVTPGPPSERERKQRAPSQTPSARSRSASLAPQPPHSSLPARPNFDALPYDEDVYTPLARPQNLHLQNSSGGDRQMFDRRGGGRRAEFEFDGNQDESDDDEAETGSISSTFEVDERYREMDIMDREEEERARARNANTTSRGGRGRGARGGDRGRGGRGGSESGRGSGGDRGRGNGRGRGDNTGASRGGVSDRPNESIVAALPMRPIGLPAKPNFPSPAVEERRTSASGSTPVLQSTAAISSSTFDFSAPSAATSTPIPASLPSNPSLKRQQGYDSSQQYPNQSSLHFGNSPFQGFGSSSMQNPYQNRFPVQQQYPHQYPSQHYQQQPQQQHRPNPSFSPSASYTSAQPSPSYSPAQGLPAATASASSTTPIASGPISVQGGHLNPRFLAQNQTTSPSASNSTVSSAPHSSAPQQAPSYQPSGTNFAYQSPASQYPQQYPRQQQYNGQYNQQQFHPSQGYQQQNSYNSAHGTPQPNYGQQQQQGYRTDSNQFQAALQQWQQTSGNGQSGGSNSLGRQQGNGRGTEK